MWTCVLVTSLAAAVVGQEDEAEDLDPYDLVNYNPNTKRMRPQVDMNIQTELVDLQRQMKLYNLVITAIVCIQLCAVVSYFLQLRRLFAFGFLLSGLILATVTGFIKEPLKQFGMNEFKSFKDLPVSLLICVLLTFTLSMMQQQQQQQPPPQQLPQPLRIEERDPLAGRDARVQAGGQQVDGDVHQDRHWPREEPDGESVETLVAGSPNAGLREEQPQAEQNPPAGSDSEDEQEAQQLEAADVEVRAEDDSPPDSLTEFKSARVPVQETHRLHAN